jgi:hypothetical protein
MFERYSEKARRTIFFARYEAGSLGSKNIHLPHLLLGLLRESPFVRELFKPHAVEAIRERLRRERQDAPLATTVDIPLSAESKRVLTLAAQEADSHSHPQINCKHLFAGLLQFPSSPMADFLSEEAGDPQELLRQVRINLERDFTETPPPDPLQANAERAPQTEFSAHYFRLARVLEAAMRLDPLADSVSDAKLKSLTTLVAWANDYRFWLSQARTVPALHIERFPSGELDTQMPWQVLVTSCIGSYTLLLRIIADLPGAKAAVPCHIGSADPIPLRQFLDRLVETAEETIRLL